MKIERSTKFKRSFKKLSKDSQANFCKKMKFFSNDIFNPQLKTHKLKPRKKQYYAFSVEFDLRVVFRIENDMIIFIDIGSHDEVY